MATRESPEDNAAADRQSATTELMTPDTYCGAIFKQRYLIENKLDQGGIGAVYLARDQELHGKQVVIKVLLDQAGQDEWLKKKFRQEVEALSRIEHPGVVGILDSGQTPDAKQFLVMQFVKGHSLRSLMVNEGMAFGQVANIIRQTGQALSAAHDQGVLHCDLKPENIMLQDLGEGEYQVKVVDFGIAKIKDSQVAAVSNDTRVAGTLPYMAPEQLENRPSSASDVFALGVIAYEMLTGRRPFNPPNQYQVLETLRAGVKIKPRDLRPSLPTAAQDIVLKALSFEARARQPRARDFGEILAQALTTDLELPTQPLAEASGADLELAHVLFMDIVGYSKFPTDQQTRIVKQLQEIVSGTEAFQRAKTGKQVISRSTGDGMALVFFSGPRAAAECAAEIDSSLRTQSEFALRMGINSGPVYRVNDMNETVDVAGAGINLAQRVMDCGDAGHILLSTSTADLLRELGEWRERIHDLGERKVKHGVRVHLYNLHYGEIGNPRLPEKISKRRKSLLAAMAIGSLMLLAVALLVWIINGRRVSDRDGASKILASSVTPDDTEDRMFSYSLTVRQVNNGKAIGTSRQIAGSEQNNFKGLDLKLNVSAAQSGFLYVLNELPGSEDGRARYQVIYPVLMDRPAGKVSTVKIPGDDDQWIPPLERQGTRRFWLVWSDSPVPEVELVRAPAKAAGGKVEDPARNQAIQDMLAKYVTAKTRTQSDGAKRQTDVIWKGHTLAYELTLEY